MAKSMKDILDEIADLQHTLEQAADGLDHLETTLRHILEGMADDVEPAADPAVCTACGAVLELVAARGYNWISYKCTCGEVQEVGVT